LPRWWLRYLVSLRSDADCALSIRDSGKVIIDLQVYNLLQLIYARLGEKELARQ
jgi:hypothetical protein